MKIRSATNSNHSRREKVIAAAFAAAFDQFDRNDGHDKKQKDQYIDSVNMDSFCHGAMMGSRGGANPKDIQIRTNSDG